MILALVELLVGNTALASCPASKKEWQKQAPPLLIAIAAKQPALETEDFSDRLGKDATALAHPYRKTKKEEFAYVQAQDSKTSLFLSGIMKCGPATGKPVLLSLSWVKGPKSGVLGGPLE